MPESSNIYKAAQKVSSILHPLESDQRKLVIDMVQKEFGFDKGLFFSMTSLFGTSQGSQVVKDKEYWLTRVKTLTAIEDGMTDNIEEMGYAPCSMHKNNEENTWIKLRIFNRDQLNRVLDETDPGNGTAMIDITIERKQMTRDELWKEIRRKAELSKILRNKRQAAQTAFDNFDQKANQLYNLLSSVMKAMNEMIAGTVRNLL